MNIIITGAAGYIGGMLINKIIDDERIDTIIGIDLLERPLHIAESKKLIWIQADLATDDWHEQASAHGPIDVVMHAAFKIRNPLWNAEVIERNNIDASDNVFAFCFDTAAKKLVHFSSVSAYGAQADNIGVLISETAPLREHRAPYGYQKRVIEEHMDDLLRSKNPATESVVLRLNSITGPRGQSLKSKFGLITFLKKLLPFIIEGNPAWARQFVHEDDLIDILEHLLFAPVRRGIRTVYNIAPETFLTARDMAKILKKRVVKIPPAVLKQLFGIAWYVSLGKIPTRPDSVDGLIYPINVDGAKIQEIGFAYRYSAKDALLARVGRYA